MAGTVLPRDQRKGVVQHGAELVRITHYACTLDHVQLVGYWRRGDGSSHSVILRNLSRVSFLSGNCHIDAEILTHHWIAVQPSLKSRGLVTWLWLLRIAGRAKAQSRHLSLALARTILAWLGPAHGLKPGRAHRTRYH
jgi:hypothetical protein